MDNSRLFLPRIYKFRIESIVFSIMLLGAYLCGAQPISGKIKDVNTPCVFVRCPKLKYMNKLP